MIDEKGRLFGKINIIDFLVVVILLVAAIAVGFKLLRGSSFFQDAPQKYTINYTVKVSDIQPEVFHGIQAYPEDVLMAGGKLYPEAKVISVTSEPHPANATVSNQSGTLLIPLEQDLLDLTFTIQAEIEDPITSLVGTQEVRIGKTHIVKTAHYELMGGVILSCNWVAGGETS